MKSRPHTHWRVLRERTVYDASPWVKVCLQHLRLPDGRKVADYHRIELPEYAVVVARTLDGKILFERQYKHGLGSVALFLPGGLIARGERPLTAARRELFEETGYRATRWKSLGAFTCSSNYGCGRAHFFVATGAHRVAAPDSGDLEDMTIVRYGPSQALSALRNGKVRVLSAALGLSLALQAVRSPRRSKAKR